MFIFAPAFETKVQAKFFKKIVKESSGIALGFRSDFFVKKSLIKIQKDLEV